MPYRNFVLFILLLLFFFVAPFIIMFESSVEVFITKSGGEANFDNPGQILFQDE